MARVCDITTYPYNKLSSDSTFVLDTNILYYMHYTKATTYDKVKDYQAEYYPRFINALIDKQIRMLTTIYNVMELLYIIEDTEYDIYTEINQKEINKKDYRDIISERILVKSELDSAYSQIKNLYEIIRFDIEIVNIDNFITTLDGHKCDNYDFLIIEYLKNNGYRNFVTDDRDFLTINGINIYTANNKVISFAKARNSLIK